MDVLVSSASRTLLSLFIAPKVRVERRFAKSAKDQRSPLGDLPWIDLQRRRLGARQEVLDLTALGRRGAVRKKSGQPIDPAKDYVVAGWGSVNEGTEGPPVWELVEKYVAGRKTITVAPNTAVRVTGG